QAVLEDLFKAEEFDDRGVHARMQAQAALVRADGRVELDAVAAVDLNLAGVIHPRHAELDEALRLHDALQNSPLLEFRMLLHIGLEALEHLADSLQEFRLAFVA